MRPYEAIAATRGSSLKPIQRLVVIHVAFRAGADGECYASATTLADDAGCDERTVRRTLAALVDLGVLHRRPRPGTSDVYRIAVTPDTMPGVTPDKLPGHPGQDVRPDTAPGRTECPVTPDTMPGVPRTNCPDTPDRMSDDPIHRSDPLIRSSDPPPPGGHPPATPRPLPEDTPTVHDPAVPYVVRGVRHDVADETHPDYGPLLALEAEDGAEVWSHQQRDRTALLTAIRQGRSRRWLEDLHARAKDRGIRRLRWGTLLGPNLAELRAELDAELRARERRAAARAPPEDEPVVIRPPPPLPTRQERT